VVPLVFGALMTMSSLSLGASDTTAFALGLIPTVLGWVGILQNGAYAASALVFICACLNVANPTGYHRFSSATSAFFTKVTSTVDHH
jgi:hypothetical protein